MVWIVACGSSSDERGGNLRKAKSEPEIKCGAVYVTDGDKTKHVTKNIVAQSAPSDEKKKRSSKYSLAVGSSFGHVHSFLKDSDHVLEAIDQTQAEDKCLMLIRKPKSASKQMLKAHSWANLSAPDMHLRRPDGSFKPNPIPKPKRMLRQSADLTLPRDQSSKWQQISANQKLPNKHLSNHSTSFKELTTVVEQQQQEETKSDVLPRQQQKIDSSENTNSYPCDPNPNFSAFGRAVSSIDLRPSASEIYNTDNIRMGGIFSRSHDKSNDKSRPKGPPPPVPNKGYKAANSSKGQQKTECNNNNTNNTQHMQIYSVDSDPRRKSNSNSRPDVILNVHDKSSNRHGKESVQIAHAKSDSGFYSETRISSDEMYDYGFKQGLDLSGGHMTSSPRAEKEKVSATQRNGESQQMNKTVQDSRPRMDPEPQRYSNKSSTVSKNISPASRQSNECKARSVNNKSDRNTYAAKDMMHKSETNLVVNKGNYGRSDMRTRNTRNERDNNTRNVRDSARNERDSARNERDNTKNEGESARNERVTPKNHSSLPYYNGNQPGSVQPRSSTGEVASMPKSDYNRQKSFEGHSQGQRPSPAKESEVMRAHSMGDLSAGCTFSLVGQKRNENVDEIDNVGLTGSQLTEHFRKYRKIKQESKHGSLPFRGKSVDDVDVRGRLDEVQYNQPSPGNGSKPQKAMHYGSLQHLPMSSESYNPDQRLMNSTKYREKTPMKPRRSLPQVPGDVDEKKKHLSEVVKTRICGSSHSNSSPSSGGSNRASEVRVGGVSATPSDREVSVLTGNHSDIVWVPPQHKKPVCNTSSSDSNHRQAVPPDGYYSSNYQSFGTTDTYVHQEHSTSGYTAPSGGRLSESGQTTLTSQSTIDSGYITTDPDQDPLSTSNYAKTVKQSAQSLYTSNKMFLPSKGEHSQGNIQNSTKGHNSQPGRERIASSKQTKETRTRSWLEKHPGSYMGDYLKMGMNASEGDLTETGQYDKIDTNNNKDTKYAERSDVRYAERSVTELDLTNSVRSKEVASKPHPLMHHLSDPSGRESDKPAGGEIGSVKCKGMSISMSQGLNMIEKNSRVGSGSFMSKSQPKFTGSLKDLLGADKQIVPIEALRGDNVQLASTLPVNWKLQQKPETSLKLLGKPSLYQLLQNYNLYAVKMKIPEGFKILENLRMIECEVVLPAISIHGASAQLTSPQGNYAKIGGPFSAFKPVSNQSAPIRSISMVTVMDLSSQIAGMFESGSIVKGDLIVEVNERLMVGEDLSSLNNLLEICHGEVLWTIARDRARECQQSKEKKDTTPIAEEFRQMEHTINELSKELRRKDRTLKQLNALLPWKQTNGIEGGDGKDQDPYICSLSEDEFIV